jgi:lysyl-tRNA synthetase class 2
VRRGERTDYLITSPEFHMKRLLTGGLPRIYQCARCFRAEELGGRHEPEFTLVEWYRAFAGWEDIAADTEEIVARVFAELSPTGAYPGGKVERPFARITVREAFAQFAQVKDAVELANQDQARFFELLTSEVEPGLASIGRPVFLTHYPLVMAALARPCPSDPSVAERFELFAGDMELSNGFGELTDPELQRGRFLDEIARRRAASEPEYPLDERFLAALAEGMPPSGGNALGLDRLVALAAGAPTIAATLPFCDEER